MPLCVKLAEESRDSGWRRGPTTPVKKNAELGIDAVPGADPHATPKTRRDSAGETKAATVTNDLNAANERLHGIYAQLQELYVVRYRFELEYDPSPLTLEPLTLETFRCDLRRLYQAFALEYNSTVPQLRQAFPELRSRILEKLEVLWCLGHCRFDVRLEDFGVSCSTPTIRHDKLLQTTLWRASTVGLESLLTEFAASEVAVKWYANPTAGLREAKALEALRHANCAVFDSPPTVGPCFCFSDSSGMVFVRPWLKLTATEWFERHKGNLRALLKATEALVSGLLFLHGKSVTHGDIHPGNILFDGDGEDAKAVLVDFGLGFLNYTKLLPKGFTYDGHRSPFIATECRAPSFAGWVMDGPENDSALQARKLADIYSLGQTLTSLLHPQLTTVGDTSEAPAAIWAPRHDLAKSLRMLCAPDPLDRAPLHKVLEEIRNLRN